MSESISNDNTSTTSTTTTTTSTSTASTSNQPLTSAAAASTTTTTTTHTSPTFQPSISSINQVGSVTRDILVPVVLWCGPPTHWITSILITPDKRTIITGSHSGHIVISSVYLDKGKENSFVPRIFSIAHQTTVSCLALCKLEGKEVAVSAGADGSLCVWSLSDGLCVRASHPGFLPCTPSSMVALPPNERNVAIVGKGSNSIYIVDTQQMRLIATLSEHTDWITSLFTCTISQDSSPLLFSGSLDGTIRFWSLKDGEMDFSLQTICLNAKGEGNCPPNEAPISIEFSPNGKSLLVVSKAYWSIFTTNNSQKLYSINCPISRGWFGGSFVNNSLVLVWTRDGRSFLYKIDQSELKSFSMGHPLPQPGTSPLYLPPNSLSQSVGGGGGGMGTSYSSLSAQCSAADNISSSSSMSSMSSVPTTAPIDIAYLSPDFSPPVLVLTFVNSEQKQQSLPINSSASNLPTSTTYGSHQPATNILSSSSMAAAVQHHQQQQQPQQQQQNNPYQTAFNNPNDITKKIGAAMCWSNIFLAGDSFGRIKIWVIPTEDIINNIQQPLSRRFLREPNLIGNIADGWKGCETKTKSRVTASLLIEDLMLLIRGYEDGSISTSKLPTDLFTKYHSGAHSAKVNCLMSSQPGNVKRLLFSASNDTTIKVWDLTSFKLLHTFSHHTGPVSSIFPLPSQRRHIFVSISEDKTLGMYSMEDLSCKHMFGVHSSSISNVYWKPEQGYLLVETIDGSTSIWEIGSGELEGVVYGQMAKDIIDNAEPLSNDWKSKHNFILDSSLSPFNTKSFVFTHKNDPPIQTIFLNIKTISDEIIKYADINSKHNASFSNTNALPQQSTSAISLVQKELNQLVSIFSYLIPWGMDRNLDPMFKKDFQLRPPQPDFSFGLIGDGYNISFLTPASSGSKVQFSEYLTAQTTLAAVSLSRSIMRIGGLENACSQLTTYYCIILPDTLPGYVYPDFSFLASFSQDNSEDVMFSARSIFKTSIERMSQSSFLNLLHYYSQFLKSDTLTLTEKARAVIVLAKIASHRKDEMPENLSLKIGMELLKMIYKGKGHLTLSAVELIGKGFSLWRDAIKDLPGLLKCLFSLTMQNDPLSSTSINSLLLIGAIDPKNFIQTIGDEVSNESNGTNSTIHALVLLGLLIKNNPDSALPYLPRVIDCILKSLDPHMPSLRESCLKQTTAVLHLMVNKYPTVSFHHETQRLILGALDGTLVIYDLKTATRWHRIEAHERSYISAVSFSDGGKSISSYSTKDNLLKIWQTSTSFFGLLSSQFACTKTIKMPFEAKPITSPKIENIKLSWSNQQQLTLIKDQNSFTLNIEG
ncbi:WD40 repeat-containing protein [Cavenderia fasciculata]|uniref:WD40 repeat-containing protein n=1 Tax=Cavenderia fasciculata TaxID=261658 RepID=F4PQT6_CACFS|nr:WD40 repeat-containing protein [Cavenderia fasciculata]EGG22044.1 WD40 repeat-containing protein [Cavenderia fasciculata]|eukprot:XP_004359895.1 WD40 repeat-containing protein [Cavenderia fasciculata]